VRRAGVADIGYRRGIVLAAGRVTDLPNSLRGPPRELKGRKTRVYRPQKKILGHNGQPHHNSSLIWCSYLSVVVRITSVEGRKHEIVDGAARGNALAGGCKHKPCGNPDCS
jgi:hypothetical protein